VCIFAHCRTATELSAEVTRQVACGKIAAVGKAHQGAECIGGGNTGKVEPGNRRFKGVGKSGRAVDCTNPGAQRRVDEFEALQIDPIAGCSYQMIGFENPELIETAGQAQSYAICVSGCAGDLHAQVQRNLSDYAVAHEPPRSRPERLPYPVQPDAAGKEAKQPWSADVKEQLQPGAQARYRAQNPVSYGAVAWWIL